VTVPTEPPQLSGVVDDDVPAPVEEPPRRDRWAVWFFTLIVVGIVTGVSLWIYEIVDKPAIRLEEERVSREGLVASVQVLATNYSKTYDYCVEISIAALSRGGFNTAEVEAQPTRDQGRIAPGQSVNFVGVFEGLTEEDYRERVDEFQAFVEHSERC
jgi:hypothetical protein